MANINLVQVMGRITRDPEVKRTQSGFLINNFSVATNKKWTDKKNGEKKSEVEFHNIVAFGKTAENIAKYFKKGDEIYISGSLKTSTWEDKEKVKHYKTEIMAERFDFGQKKSEEKRQQGKKVIEDEMPTVDNFEFAPLPCDEDDIDVKNIPF